MTAFLTIVVATIYILSNPHIFLPPSPAQQSDCILQTIGNGDIVGSQELDVDNTLDLDQVYVYGIERLYVLVVLNPESNLCEIVLNEYLTSIALRDGLQIVDVKTIELVELTGDDQPELHIWLDKMGGGRFSSAAVHSIYTAESGSWEEALHIEQCLAFNSFEFRRVAGGESQEIYRDSDLVCDSPFSFDRDYDVFTWNGTEFVVTRSGKITDLSFYPPVWNVIFPITFAVIVFLLGSAINHLRKSNY